MSKAQMTRVLCAYEHKCPGSAAEKLAQRGDLEAMINQLEEESHAKAGELLPVARQRLQDALDDVKKPSQNRIGRVCKMVRFWARIALGL